MAGLPEYLITYLLTYDLLMFVSFFIFLTVFKLHFFVFKCYPYDCVADHTGMFQLDDTISSPLLPLQFTPPDIPKRARIRRTIDFFLFKKITLFSVYFFSKVFIILYIV